MEINPKKKKKKYLSKFTKILAEIKKLLSNLINIVRV